MPIFLVLEGVDGTGKTTLAHLLKEKFFLNQNSIVLFEPTKTSPYSEKIYQILHSEKSLTEELRKTLLDLFYQDRLWDIQNCIKPALNQKKHVILDRYFLSTCAYQAKNKTEAQAILQKYLNDCQILWPDCLFYLKVSLDKLWERILKRKKNLQLFENPENLQKVLENYDSIIPLLPFPVFIIDANFEIEKVYQKTAKILTNYIQNENFSHSL